jgi:threonine/homoserine/homoserine lactone efflux protein
MSLVAYGLTLAAVTAAPGPIVAVVVARVLGGQRQLAVAFAAGVLLGDLLAVVLAASGMAFWAERFPQLFVALHYAGIGYLIVIAVDLWRTAAQPEVGPRPQAAAHCGLAVAAGFLTCVSSPFTFVFYVSILPTALDPSFVAPQALPALVAATAATVASVLASYGLLAAQAQRLLRAPRSRALLGRGSACVCGSTALWMAVI